MIVPFQLNKSQRLVVNGATKDDSPRLVLASICITKDKDGKGCAVVTDGYILVEKRIDYDGDETILLNAKDVAACKDDKQLGAVSFTPDGDNAIQAIVDDGIRKVRLVQGDFPDYEKLFPTGEPVFRIGLGRDVLLKLLKCLDEKNGENDIAFFFRGSSLPVEFRVGDDVRGLIMPLYIAGVTDYKPVEKSSADEQEAT